MKFIVIVLCFVSISATAQITILSEKGEPLPASTLYFPELSKGLTADENGRIQLPVTISGQYKGIVRFLGYKPDTAIFMITEKSVTPQQIIMKSNDLLFRTVVVYGEKYTYAQRLLLAAIEAKKERNQDISSLTFDGYHSFKFVKDRKVLKKSGDSALVQFPPQETISKNYWTAEKGIFRTITEQRLLPLLNFDLQQMYAKNNYYTLDQNEIFIGSQSFKSPISDDAIDFYHVELLDSTITPTGMTYKLFVEPENKNRFGFQGSLEIDSKSYNPVRFTATHNLPLSGFMIFGYTTDIIFGPVAQRAWLPVSFQETFKFLPYSITDSLGNQFPYISNLISHYANYQFNQEENIDIQKIGYVNNLTPTTDSLTTKAFKLIPLTEKEKRSIFVLDSVSRTFSTAAIIARTGSFLVNLSKYPITSFHDLVRYNRVEGLYLGIGYRPRFSTESFQYEVISGFSFGSQSFLLGSKADYYFKRLQNLHLSGEIFSGTKPINLFNYSSLTTATFNSLFTKSDLFNYYRSQSVRYAIEIEPIDHFKIRTGMNHEKTMSLSNSVDFSFASSPRHFRENPVIREGFYNLLETSFTYDNRRYNQMLFSKMPIKDDFTLLARLDFTTNEFSSFSSTSRFSIFKLRIDHEYFFWNKWFYATKITGIFSNSDLPPQYTESIASSSEGASGQGVMMNLKGATYGGNQQVQGFFEIHTLDTFVPFTGFLPGWLGSPDVIFFHQMAFAQNSNNFSSAWKTTHDKPYGETGFGIGNIFGSFRVDFAWTTQSIDSIQGFAFRFGGSLTF